MIYNRLEEATSATILIVDDSPEDLSLLSNLLMQNGYQVKGVNQGKQALAAAELAQPDLILLDVKMPEMNGYEVCQSLKASSKTSQIPIIFLSAFNQVNLQIKAFQVGGVDYIAKPCQAEEVLVRIKNHLRLQTLQKQLTEQNRQMRQEIQERQLLEQKLRSSEAAVRGFFEAMTDLILLIDAEGNLVQAAPTNPARFYPANFDLISQTIEQLSIGQQDQQFHGYIQQAIATQQIIHFEYSLRVEEQAFDAATGDSGTSSQNLSPDLVVTAPEEEIWFAASLTPTSNNSVVWVARDITARKRAETALLESKHRLQKQQAALIELAKCPMFYEGELNAALKVLTQISARTLNVERVSVWFYDRDRTKICLEESFEPSTTPDLGQERFATDSPTYFTSLENGELIVVDKVQTDSRSQELYSDWLAPLEISSILDVPIRYHGQTLGVISHDHVGYPRCWTIEEQNFASYLAYMVSLAIGARDRAAAEQALQRRAEIDSLLSSISRAFIDRDIQAATHFTLHKLGEFMQGDRCCLSQYQDNQQYSMTAEWCAPGIQSLMPQCQNCSTAVSPWLHQQILQGKLVQSCLADLPATAAAEQIEFSRQAIESLIAVPMIHAGKVVGYISLEAICSKRIWQPEEVVLLQRVGEIIAIGQARHQAEEALKQAKEEADAANRVKSQFLANMSHELRTPLNAILGFTQVMQRDTSLDATQLSYLKIISSSGEHLLDLIDDVLDMAKIEAGRITLNEHPFDLHYLLNSLEEMLNFKAKAKNLQLLFTSNPEVPQYIQTDEAKLRQVLINLLSNAIKFTPSGSVTLQVKTQSACRDKGNPQSLCLRFEVADTGPGIAAQELDSLFAPFVQTEVGRQYQSGTGLGLAISRKFVQLLGGDINVSTALGQGSIFRFSIPVSSAQITEVLPKQIKRRVIALAPNQPQYRILVAEDKWESRKLLRKLLEPLGFEVREAQNGQEAVAIWESWLPHLIWMDMRMPVMDGYEATKQIKAHCQGQATAIIALTASALDQEKAAILTSGCDDFVRKPFREEAIFQKIAEYLGVRYCYEETIDFPAEVTPAAFPQLHTQLKRMPSDWLNELFQAAMLADEELIFQLIEQIPENSNVLAEALKRLVTNFRFDHIMSVAQAALA